MVANRAVAKRVGIGAPTQVTPLMHGLQPLSNLALPLVKSVDQVLATLWVCLEQLSGEASQGAATLALDLPSALNPARSCGPRDPVFDLLLEPVDESLPTVVVEVKSTTATKEEKQLRLALGQVLRYRQLLRAGAADVVGFIAIEGPPRDRSWIELCASARVLLVWPATVAGALRGLT